MEECFRFPRQARVFIFLGGGMFSVYVAETLKKNLADETTTWTWAMFARINVASVVLHELGGAWQLMSNHPIY